MNGSTVYFCASIPPQSWEGRKLGREQCLLSSLFVPEVLSESTCVSWGKRATLSVFVCVDVCVSVIQSIPKSMRSLLFDGVRMWVWTIRWRSGSDRQPPYQSLCVFVLFVLHFEYTFSPQSVSSRSNSRVYKAQSVDCWLRSSCWDGTTATQSLKPQKRHVQRNMSSINSICTNASDVLACQMSACILIRKRLNIVYSQAVIAACLRCSAPPLLWELMWDLNLLCRHQIRGCALTI